ncbi:MAG TPA: hypothetical protein VMS93_04405 [Candidatus Saccharimonadales bacterium]|nr:hypothetical protein [Candidatus Saccharimonadales bacterium]
MNRVLLVFTCLCLVALSAAPALAVPIPGLYNSTDLGGSLLLGRSATSWALVHGNFGVGDVFNVQSWNGTALGTQWHAECGQEPNAYTVTDNRVGGVGPVIYSSTFNGGSIWFAPGPWGSGSGALGTTYVVTTVQFVLVGGVSTAVSSRANIQSSGTFTDGGCTLTFVIANGTGVGQTDAPPPFNVKPATYPAFMDLVCAPSRIYGSWGDLSQITLMIRCTVPAKPPTWGSIRRIYR